MATGIDDIKSVVVVLSGKGGVGKSTTVTVLAHILASQGSSVGVLDTDLCGPSLARMCGIKGNIHSNEYGWIPIRSNIGKGYLSMISLSHLVDNQDHAVIWRGPKKTSIIKQFLRDVCWGKLEYLFIDTPPGTSDEHMAIMECIPGVSAVLVTSPQAVAVADVLRQVTFCRKTNAKILGIVETMSGFVCPNCSDCSLIFSQGGGERLANHCKVPFLGSVPIDPKLCEDLDKGDLSESSTKYASYKQYCDIAKSITCNENMELG